MKFSKPLFEELLRSAKQHQDVAAGTTVYFHWWLASSAGAGFTLLREPQHTDKEIIKAKSVIRNSRDVVTMNVASYDNL